VSGCFIFFSYPSYLEQFNQFTSFCGRVDVANQCTNANQILPMDGWPDGLMSGTCFAVHCVLKLSQSRSMVQDLWCFVQARLCQTHPDFPSILLLFCLWNVGFFSWLWVVERSDEKKTLKTMEFILHALIYHIYIILITIMIIIMVIIIVIIMDNIYIYYIIYIHTGINLSQIQKPWA
jgi:hypothetical protein